MFRKISLCGAAFFLTSLSLGCSRYGGAQTITQLEFYRLSDGISYAKAQGVIGAPGQLRSTSTVFTTYEWINSDSSKAIIVFKEDRLFSKNWYRSRYENRRRR